MNSQKRALSAAIRQGIVPSSTNPNVVRLDRLSVDSKLLVAPVEQFKHMDLINSSTPSFQAVAIEVERVRINGKPQVTLCFAWDSQGNTLYYAFDKAICG